MPRIVSSAVSVPAHVVSQADAKEVATRYLVQPLEFYSQPRSLEERNKEFVRTGVDLVEKAVRDCLSKSTVTVSQIDHIFFVTTTGLSTPSVDALLSHRMGFRLDVRRTPIFGLGCSGGVAALSRANEYCRAYPKHRALVVSLEIGSLLFSTQAGTPTDLVGASPFGDGAAAMVVGGDEVAFTGAKTLFSRSLLFPGTEEVMSCRFTGDGMRLVLSEEVPSIVREKVKPALESFVLSLGLTLSRLHYYLLHPSGPKVLEAYQEVFGLRSEAMEPIRNSLRRYGDLSSAAVLFVLDEFLAHGRPKAGEKAIVIALGPGFGAEMLLLGW